MNILSIIRLSYKNILRNRRRTIFTIFIIASCVAAALIFGGYVTNLILSYKTGTIIRVGHITIYNDKYVDFGAGNPAKYGIKDYSELINKIKNKKELKDKIYVITPIINAIGVASHSKNGTSTNFYGIGWIPSDHEKMLTWDEYKVMNSWWYERLKQASDLGDQNFHIGVVGDGLSRILGFCEHYKVSNCPTQNFKDENADVSDNFPSELLNLPKNSNNEIYSNKMSRIELLTVSSNGSPNATSMYVRDAINMGVKEFSDIYVGLNFKLAQKLVFNDEEHASGIVIQLKSSNHIQFVKSILNEIIEENHSGLKAYSFDEITPLYSQVIGMFGSIFTFIAAIVGLICIFTVVNTMSMSVMERVSEIGTNRALGTSKKEVAIQFICEGGLIGGIASVLGCLLGLAISFLINSLNLTWYPPGNDAAIPLTLIFYEIEFTMIFIWIFFTIISILASSIPAIKASRMIIVDAIRHY